MLNIIYITLENCLCLSVSNNGFDDYFEINYLSPGKLYITERKRKQETKKENHRSTNKQCNGKSIGVSFKAMKLFPSISKGLNLENSRLVEFSFGAESLHV